jgi:hypothetical protein
MPPQKKKQKRTKSKTGFAKSYDYFWKKNSIPFREAQKTGRSQIYARETLGEMQTFHAGYTITKKKSGGFIAKGFGEYHGEKVIIDKKTPLAAAKELRRQEWGFKSWDKKSKKEFTEWMKDCSFDKKEGVNQGIRLREEETFPENYDF